MGKPARERRRLAFDRSQRLFRLPTQSLDLLLKSLVLAPQLPDFAFQPGDLFSVGFLRHVPAYPASRCRQAQSRENLHHAKQIRGDLSAGTRCFITCEPDFSFVSAFSVAGFASCNDLPANRFRKPGQATMSCQTRDSMLPAPVPAIERPSSNLRQPRILLRCQIH